MFALNIMNLKMFKVTHCVKKCCSFQDENYSLEEEECISNCDRKMTSYEK